MELVVTPPGIREACVLTSIRSASIQKITLIYQFSPGRDRIDWEIFDEPLCLLVDQLGCTHRLEVYFKIIAEGVVEVDQATEMVRIVDSLVGFRERGQIRLVWMDLDEGKSDVYEPR